MYSAASYTFCKTDLFHLLGAHDLKTVSFVIMVQGQTQS